MKRLVAVLALAACGHDAAPPAEQHADLGGAEVARVGAERIAVPLVEGVARAKGIAPRAALDDLVDDSLAAQGARAAGMESDPTVSWPILSARARVTATKIRDEARQKGPPTDKEIADLTAVHWRKLDVPEGVKVIHAVALYPTQRTPTNEAAVRTTSDRIAAAVAGAPDADEFEKRARAVVPEGKVKVTVETLSFAVDARSLDHPNQAVEQPFVTASVALHAKGDVGRAETKYGHHVIWLIERLPAHRVSLEERRAILTEEALATRAHDLYEARLADLRTKFPVQVSTAAEDLMKSVSLERP
jgi:hypothetical protein